MKKGWFWMLPFFLRECSSEMVQHLVLSRVSFYYFFFSFELFEEGQEKSTDSIQGWYQIDFPQALDTIRWISVRRISNSFSHFTVQMVRKEPLCPTRMLVKQYNTVCFSGWSSALEYSVVLTLLVYSTEHHMARLKELRFFGEKQWIHL